MTPEERATQFWKDLEVGMKAASHLLLDLIQDTRSAAFEEAAKTLKEIAHQIDCSDTFNDAGLRENDKVWDSGVCSPWRFQNSILRDMVEAAIRQHANGDGK